MCLRMFSERISLKNVPSNYLKADGLRTKAAVHYFATF